MNLNREETGWEFFFRPGLSALLYKKNDRHRSRSSSALGFE